MIVRNNDWWNSEEQLPWIKEAIIPEYWYKRIPSNYPASSSTFSFIMTEAEKEAVKEMEENIYTEESIISPEVIPEHSAIGTYLGTFDVTGEAGVETLLSPVRVPSTVTGVAAYHYNEEEDAWTQIESAELKDGYVWGTLDEFSPIAVFTFRRDSYISENDPGFKKNVFVCAGIYTKIYKDDEDKIIAEDGYGKKTELSEDMIVVGGCIDGSSLDSTDLYIGEGVKLLKVAGGSYCMSKEDTFKNHVGKIKLVCEGAEFTQAITGAGVWCSADEVYIEVKNVKASGLGCQEAYRQGMDSNKTLEDAMKGLAANQWVKHSKIVVKDSDIQVLYCAGNNGYSYTKDAEIEVDGGTYEWYCTGQSNGRVDNSTAKVANANIHYFNHNNRGSYGSGKSIMKGCTIEEGYVFADPTEESADVTGKVAVDFDAECVVNNYCVGRIVNTVVADHETAKKYIEYVKASRDAQITYTNNAVEILGDLLAIK